MLSKLKHLDDFSKNWWITIGVQWTNRASSEWVVVLLLFGTSQGNDQYTEIGGVIAIVSPFIEIITSQVSDKVYEVKKNEWEEFINNIENLLDNYHELLGILENVKKSELGAVNKALNELRDEVKKFLEKYVKKIMVKKTE